MQKLLFHFLFFVLTLINAPVTTVYAANMLLGPGDVVKIMVYDHADLLTEARISETGAISYPLIGDVSVAGLTSIDAGKKIAAMLERGAFIKNPQVSVLVTSMQSQQVSILGQIARPGRYPIDGPRTITDMIAAAGGLNAEAGDAVVLLRPNNGAPKKEVFDFGSLVRNDGLGTNLEVSAGDTIFVDRASHFYIYGEVQKPGIYKLEKSMTILQALSVGGGLTPRGTQRGIVVKRRDAAGKMTELKPQSDDVIQADDVVFIRESLF